MPKFASGEFRTNSEYQRAVETFARFSGLLLFGFARHPLGTKHQILQNFIARTITMTRGIMALWDMGDAQDCWILHRCLIDRYFHLVELGRTNSYEIFDDWSFMRQTEAQNRIRSDPSCRDLLDSPMFKNTAEQKVRYAALQKTPPQWKRPKAEEVAKRSNLQFLYAYSYDYASCHVHPMANDGLEEFYTITKLEPKPEFPSQVSVIHNTLLVGCLIVKEALNQSDLRWMAIVYNFFDHLMKHLEDASTDYLETFAKIVLSGRSAELCDPLN